MHGFNLVLNNKNKMES